MHFPRTTAKVDRPSHKGYDKSHPDVTITRGCNLEYDMNTALVHAYYASERLAESNNRHETLPQYNTTLHKDSNMIIPHRELNKPLEHARSVKIDRHRILGLPSILY